MIGHNPGAKGNPKKLSRMQNMHLRDNIKKAAQTKVAAAVFLRHYTALLYPKKAVQITKQVF